MHAWYRQIAFAFFLYVAELFGCIKSDPKLIKEIIDAVTIPVMAKVRVGHFVEAQIVQAIGADYIDESEVLTPADESVCRSSTL